MGSAKKSKKTAAPAKAADAQASKERFAPGTLARAVGQSGNVKIGDAATTYAEQRSCPESCAFFDGGGCYAEEGRVGQYVTAPLNRAAAKVEATPERIAAYEAMEIDSLKVKPGRPLRLHTVGDCKTDKAAETVAKAARRYVGRGGGPAWTYTHAWRDVARESWRDVNVLASCERPMDVLEAQRRGYATAMVVEEFPTKKQFRVGAVRLIPCPAQTKKGVTCASCQLCMNATRLLEERLTIAFEVHGSGTTQRAAKQSLRNPSDRRRSKSSRFGIPRFIRRFRKRVGKEPKNAQIARGLGISPSSVAQMRKRLADEAAARAEDSVETPS